MPFALEPGVHPGAPYALAWLALGAVLVGAVAALTHQHGRAWSASVLYVAVGLGAAAVIELLGVRWLDPVGSPDAVLRVTELAIVVALFANGVRIDRELTLQRWRPTVRLLAIAMPLSIGAIALLGHGLLGLSAGAAIALGAVLAPTDPVLAGDVGETKPGEEEPEAEFAITSEASLNDGLAAPFLVLGLLVAEGRDGAGDLAAWVGVDLLLRCAIGVAAGAAVGWLAGRLMPQLRERGAMSTAYDGLLTIGLGLACFGIGELLGGYGFLAAFAGGVAFRRVEHEHDTHEEVHEGADRVERLLELVVLLLVSSSVTTAVLDVPGVGGWAIAVLSAVLVRPLVGLLALTRLPDSTARERAYVAWFGVRGAGTLYYAAAVIASGVIAPDEAAVVWWTAVAAVLVSIGLHGVSSGPFTSRMQADREEAGTHARQARKSGDGSGPRPFPGTSGG